MELAEPDYRRIVADNVKTLFPQASIGDLEISAVRMVDHLKGQAWLTCLKLDAHGAAQYYHFHPGREGYRFTSGRNCRSMT